MALSWMIPDMSNGNITGYELEFSPVVSYSQIHPTLTATVSGLSPGTKYQFRVAAVTAEGRQPFSDIIYHNTASKFSRVHYVHICAQIFQNECYTCAVSSLTFHVHLMDITIDVNVYTNTKSL